MYESFKKVVENIFNNWTALQLAVEHSMGGPDSKEIALTAIDDLTKYCIDYEVEATDIEDQLEDFMDQRFNTTCEDGSIKEISSLLYRFLQLLQENNLEQVEVEYSKLPKSNIQRLGGVQQQQQSPVHPVQEVEEEIVQDAPMDDGPVDPEWIEVKSKRKR